MPAAFTTNPIALGELLKECHNGSIQLPDFQRSWVWDEDRIKSLIASVSRAFPIGAVMTLQVGGEVEFKPRPIEGAPTPDHDASSLVLDGQQRLTSLYQVAYRGHVVETVTPKKKRVKRWFYIDMQKALDVETDRESAVLGLPEDRKLKSDFDRKVDLDVSTRDLEFEHLMFPVAELFRADEWLEEFNDYLFDREDRQTLKEIQRRFRKEVVNNFTSYQVPVIALAKDTSKAAVCIVFEKVNTGGKPLDAFELITAMYAADGHELRKDWYGDGSRPGREQRLAQAYRAPGASKGILAGVGNTDFLQAVALLDSVERREAARAAGSTATDLPQVTATRAAILGLPLTAYKRHQERVEEAFLTVARFLHTQRIFRVYDLPYQSQLVPLAVMFAMLGDEWEPQASRAKIKQWYWNGVFGELYGSTTETAIARDAVEVPGWVRGGPVPTTVTDATFRADRLLTMRMRLSAAYKGVNALLMGAGARDFRTGQQFGDAVFFDENVDIHHVFPQKWCEDHGIARSVYDSIINKTPLSARTNRIIGGVAPSSYLTRLESGGVDTPGVASSVLDDHLRSHLIDPDLLRADKFDAFMAARQRALISLIEQKTGRAVYQGEASEEGIDVESTDEEEAAAA